MARVQNQGWRAVNKAIMIAVVEHSTRLSCRFWIVLLSGIMYRTVPCGTAQWTSSAIDNKPCCCVVFADKSSQESSQVSQLKSSQAKHIHSFTFIIWFVDAIS